MPGHLFFRQLIAMSAFFMLSGCIFSNSAPTHYYLSKELPIDDDLIQFDVNFSRKPDYEFNSSWVRVNEESSILGKAPKIQLEDYKEGLEFDMAIDIYILFPYIYPTWKIGSASARTEVYSEKIDDLNYRFILPERKGFGWRSSQSLELSFGSRYRYDNIAFEFSPDAVCETKLQVTTPVYGQMLNVQMKFPDGGGCLRVCDIPSSSSSAAGICSFGPGKALIARPGRSN